MENPVFKLERVVRSKSEEMQDFEGPLDLILYLLGRNKMEIQDISISLICDQYLAWLDQRQKMDLEVASEFVTMASQLVYIKTRMLLSLEDEEAKNEMDALIQSLEERRRNEQYLTIKALAQRLAPMGEFGRSILTRDPEPVERGKIYEYSQDRADLILAMAEIRSRSERSLPAAPGGLPGYCAARALSGGKQGKRNSAAFAGTRYDPLFAAVPGEPEPQRGGGHLPGGAGIVPGPCAAFGRLRDGLYGPAGGRAAGEFELRRRTKRGIHGYEGDRVRC